MHDSFCVSWRIDLVSLFSHAGYHLDPKFAPEPENEEPFKMQRSRGTCSVHIPSAPGRLLSKTQMRKLDDPDHPNHVCDTCVKEKKPWWNNCFAPNKQAHDRLKEFRVSSRMWALEDELPEPIESGTLPIADDNGTPVGKLKQHILHCIFHTIFSIVMFSVSILVDKAFDDWNGPPLLTECSTQAGADAVIQASTRIVEEIIQRSRAEEWTSPHFRDSLLVSFKLPDLPCFHGAYI